MVENILFYKLDESKEARDQQYTLLQKIEQIK